MNGNVFVERNYTYVPFRRCSFQDIKNVKDGPELYNDGGFPYYPFMCPQFGNTPMQLENNEMSQSGRTLAFKIEKCTAAECKTPLEIDEFLEKTSIKIVSINEQIDFG